MVNKIKKNFNANFENTIFLQEDRLIKWFVRETYNKKIYYSTIGKIIFMILGFLPFLAMFFLTQAIENGNTLGSKFKVLNINLLPYYFFIITFILFMIIWIVTMVYRKKYTGDIVFFSLINCYVYLIFLLLFINLFFAQFMIIELFYIGYFFIVLFPIGYGIYLSKNRMNLIFTTLDGSAVGHTKDKIKILMLKLFKFGGIILGSIIILKYVLGYFFKEFYTPDFIILLGLSLMLSLWNFVVIIGSAYVMFPYFLSRYYRLKYKKEYQEYDRQKGENIDGK